MISIVNQLSYNEKKLLQTINQLMQTLMELKVGHVNFITIL